MKSSRIAAFIVTSAVALYSLSALAADVAPNQCLQVYQIDHTQIVDDQTILFHLRGGQVLKNTLDGRCVGLKLATRGYTYVARNDEVCGNLQSIRVNDTGEVCELGPFTAYTPPPSR